MDFVGHNQSYVRLNYIVSLGFTLTSSFPSVYQVPSVHRFNTCRYFPGSQEDRTTSGIVFHDGM